MMERKLNRFITILVMLAVLLGIGMVQAKAGPAFAGEAPTLEVWKDDTLQKAYTMSDLEKIWKAEGQRSYTYTGFNTYPTLKIVENAEGPTVQGILKDALGGKALDALGADRMIEFIARDGNREGFLKEQLLVERYFFPNSDWESGREGAAVQEGSDAGAIPVPATLSLREDGKVFGLGSGDGIDDHIGRVLFGQQSPHEQNHAAYIHYMAAEKQKASKIIVHSEAAESWNPIEKMTGVKDGAAEIGASLGFEKDVNPFSAGKAAGRYWIYYTLDGSDPTLDSAIYNYNSNAGSSQNYNCPVPTEYGTLTIKTIVKGYGKKDSAVSTFHIEVVPLKKPAIKSLTQKGKAITVKWKADPKLSGYQILRAEKKNGKYKVVKTINKGTAASWKNTGLKKGKTYYYQLRSFRNVSGKKVYSRVSAVKYKKVK